MFFGYTNCPDYCPATLTTLAALEKQLRAAKTVAPPQVIFVSVDAKRDTPAQLNEFVPNFDPEFIGLTAASQPAIEALAKKWGVAVSIQTAANGNYIVDHSERDLRHRSRRQSRRHPDRPVHGRRPATRFSAHRDRRRMKSGRLFVWFQHMLPQHALSRLVLRATRVRAPWFKNWLIRRFLASSTPST